MGRAGTTRHHRIQASTVRAHTGWRHRDGAAPMMSPAVRKAALVTHVAASVGWIGAILASLILGVVGVASDDRQTVRAVYVVLEPLGSYALVPLSVAALATGLLQSLGTNWGLLRHYWVVTKLLMNLFATGVLLLYMQTLTVLADAARGLDGSDDLADLQSPSPAVHAAAAIALLTVALVLSVYKPRGLTAYGYRRQRATPPL
jgi:hypothetical protein